MVLPPRRTSGLAIGSLVCAIFGWGPGSIVAVILGHVALRQIRRDPLRVKGKGVAKAGIVIGWVGIVALTIVIWLGIHFRKMFEEEPQRPQTREVNLTAAESLPVDNLPFAEPCESRFVASLGMIGLGSRQTLGTIRMHARTRPQRLKPHRFCILYGHD